MTSGGSIINSKNSGEVGRVEIGESEEIRRRSGWRWGGQSGE